MVDAVIVSAGPLARIDRVRGVVHAVYPGSVYIATSDGPLLVVHGPGYGHTPTSLVVAGARRDEWGAARGDIVTGKLGYLRFGSTLLDARHARVWQPRRAVHRGATASAETLRAIIREIPGDAMARLHSACRRLVTVLAAADATALGAGTRALVGNGPGLTPSGDDALVGLLAVLHRVGPTELCSDALRLLAESLDALLCRTTTIGAHYLRLAIDGHFGEHLTDLVDALGSGNGVRAEQVARVRATGATSGADALVGVVAGLRLLRKCLPARQRMEMA
jgi:hypothetical protein